MPGGLLAAYSGQYHLDRVLTSLSERLEYMWLISVVGRGPKTLIHGRKTYARWKPILLFCRPPFEKESIEWFDDLFQGNGPEKKHHEWQQSEAEAIYYIEAFTKPGDVVVDPFLGSGTTGVAAVGLGRRFIGADSDAAAVREAVRRLKRAHGR